MQSNTSAFYRPVTGSLNNPAVIDEYQSGNFGQAAYPDNFLDELLRDQEGRLIGSVPKLGSEEPVKAPRDFSNVKSALSAVGEIAPQVMQAHSSLARSEHNQDVAHGQALGRYLTDPGMAAKPDVEGAMSAIPSARDSMVQGTITGGAMGGGAGEVIGNKAVQRGMQGAAAGGPIGAGVGVLVGVLEGVFGWRAAGKEDEKRKKSAQAEFERSLKEWTVRKNRRISAQREQSFLRARSDKERRKDKKDFEERRDKKEKVETIAGRRQQMAAAIMGAGQGASQMRNERIARWR
jgi:hypothetical protein